MKKLHIIKIGGQVIDDPLKLASFLKDLSSIPSPVILVHGGGALATRLAEQLNTPQQLVGGRRITDSDTLRIATMVYAGLINKQLVASLQAAGTDAIGLSGADLNCMKATIRIKEGIDYGFVGDLGPGSVRSNRFYTLLEMGCTPVVCAITHDGKGQLLNTNADTIASALATAMSPFYNVTLNYCFEKKGVLRDPNDLNSVIRKLCKEDYLQLKDSGSIHSGMIPKLDNAFRALEEGVAKVTIGEAEELTHIIQHSDCHGTELRA